MNKDISQLLEFEDPFKDVHFPYNLAYQVKYDECDNQLEMRNEHIAALVAQKYDLIYRQADGISTKSSELTNELIMAHDEIGKYMPVGEIGKIGEPFNVYYFIFDSTSIVI